MMRGIGSENLNENCINIFCVFQKKEIGYAELKVPHERTHTTRSLVGSFCFTCFAARAKGCGMASLRHFGRYNEPAIRNGELCELTCPKSPLKHMFRLLQIIILCIM